jgi:hypothetical protein
LAIFFTVHQNHFPIHIGCICHGVSHPHTTAAPLLCSSSARPPCRSLCCSRHCSCSASLPCYSCRCSCSCSARVVLLLPLRFLILRNRNNRNKFDSYSRLTELTERTELYQLYFTYLHFVRLYLVYV